MQLAIMRDTHPYHYWASTVRDSWLDVPWGIRHIFLSPNSHSPIGYMKHKPALIRPIILRQVLKFKQRRAKHHAKHNRWYRSDNMGRLITLFDFSPADFKRFLTVLADRCLIGNHCLFLARAAVISSCLKKNSDMK
jgi:hypothetical protein